MLMLSSHGLLCRQRDTFMSLLSCTRFTSQFSLLIMVWRQSRDRQALSVSEGEYGLYGLSPASHFQDVSTFTRSVTSGYCVLCSLGFVFGFSCQKET